MSKFLGIVLALVAAVGLSLVVVGCGSPASGSKDKMGDKMGEKMSDKDKMGDKMGGKDKMDQDKMKDKDKMDTK